MKRILSAVLLVGGLVMATTSVASATQQEKVTICHRTNSDTNPYVLITVNGNAVDGEGHNDHTLHVVDENHARADIIPALLDEDDEPFCPGPELPPGPEGPQGPTGEQGPPGLPGSDGEDGKDGADGRTPIALCWPNLGVGFTFAGEPIPDGAHVLGTGAICPMTGATGPVGPAGPAGPAGTVAETPVTAPVSQPVGELPHTGLSNWLWIAGAALLLTGVMFSLVGRRSTV